MERILTAEQHKLNENGYRIEFPPIFRVDSETTETNQVPELTQTDPLLAEKSLYSLWTGFKLNAWNTSCEVVKKQGEEHFSKKQRKVSQTEQSNLKLAIRMQGGAFMYVNRLGSYH